jgi:acyl-homoserine lactone acylase PvdQ
MLVPGQSGHPASRYYANNIRGWLKGEYHPMLFDRQAVLGVVTQRLNLLPI